MKLPPWALPGLFQYCNNEDGIRDFLEKKGVSACKTYNLKAQH